MLAKHILEQKDRKVITGKTSMSIDEAMEILINNKIGCLPILDEGGVLIGILSDKDIFKKVYDTKGDYHNLKVKDLMISELIVGLPDDDLTYIAGLMDKNWIRHIPIVDGDNLVGILSQRDIIRTQSSKHEIENRYLNLYMDMLHRRDKSGDA